MSELINKIWIQDEIILPHYIICGILIENNFMIKNSRLKKIINSFIIDNRIIINKSDKAIINEGVKFLLRHSVIVRKNDYYVGTKNEIIMKFAGLIKR